MHDNTAHRFLEYRLASASRSASGAWGATRRTAPGEIVVGFSTANVVPRRTRKMVYKMKLLLVARLDPLYEAVMEATEEAILNSMCMASEMAGAHGHLVPALPLDEVRRFVDATRPIFASVKLRPDQPAVPATEDVPVDSQLGFNLDEAPPTSVRSAEGMPFPTRPGPHEEDE